MRTKTLCCIAAFAACIATSTMAQSNVYSLNVVGYVSKGFQGASGAAKLNIVANPLNTTNNTINGVLNSTTIPFGANFFHWNGSGFDTATWLGDSWDNNYNFPPGEGGFVLTDSNFTNTFVGEVLQGSLTNSFGVGFSLKASLVPQAGDLDTLGLGSALGVGDNVLKWNFATQGYDTFTFLGGGAAGWDPSQPSVAVAEGFFINSTAGGKWVRNFTVQ